MAISSRNSLSAWAVSVICGVTFALAANGLNAAIVVVPGVGGTNLMSTGLDTTTGPARASVAPVFPGNFHQVAGSEMSVAGTGDLTPDYAISFINDDTGFNFLSDSVTGSGILGTNRGWIPDGTGTESATFTFTGGLEDGVGLAGIDFLTLFTNRTAGTFTFEYSDDNQSNWTEIFTLSNSTANEVFRQGVKFDPIFGATDVRLTTTAANSELFLGEVDFFTVAVPEPSSLLMLGIGVSMIGCRRYRLANRTRRSIPEAH